MTWNLDLRRYLQYWNASFDTYLTDVSGSATDPAAGNVSALLAAVNTLTFPDKSCAAVL